MISILKAAAVGLGATAILAASTGDAVSAAPAKRVSDIVISGGSIYNGGSAKPFVGDVAILGDKIV